MVSASACQAEDGSSILLSRSKNFRKIIFINKREMNAIKQHIEIKCGMYRWFYQALLVLFAYISCECGIV